MLGSFLVLFREGFEASLLIAIVVAYVAKVGGSRGTRAVWYGVGGALVVSVIAGAALFATSSGLEGTTRLIFNGVAMWFAVGVLTYMVLWMSRQSRTVAQDIRRGVDEALERGSLVALATLAFVVVFREGLETALFMFGITQAANPLGVATGAALGIAAAVGLGYAVYAGGRRINMGAFFKITGALILVVAAGLLAQGVAMFEMAGLWPAVFYPLWDVTGVTLLTSQSIAGQLLTGFLGWDPKPDLIEFAAWAVYIAAIGYAFLRLAASPAQPTARANS